MTIETGQNRIPNHLRPLYEARTAGKSIEQAIKLLGSLSGQKQREIIEDSVFGTIVRSALATSDEQKPLREKRLFESVEKNSFQALDEAIHSSPSSF